MTSNTYKKSNQCRSILNLNLSSIERSKSLKCNFFLQFNIKQLVNDMELNGKKNHLKNLDPSWCLIDPTLRWIYVGYLNIIFMLYVLNYLFVIFFIDVDSIKMQLEVLYVEFRSITTLGAKYPLFL